MLKVQFDGDVLGVRPDGPITREDVATLTRAGGEYTAGHPKDRWRDLRDADISGLRERRRFRRLRLRRLRCCAPRPPSACRIGHRFSPRASRGVHGQSRRGGADATLPICRGRGGTGMAQVDLRAAWPMVTQAWATGVGSPCRISVGHSGQRIVHYCRWSCG
jgi:hypothetical protein